MSVSGTIQHMRFSLVVALGASLIVSFTANMAFLSGASAAVQTILVVKSHKGDFVGGGLKYIHTENDSTFKAYVSADGNSVGILVDRSDGNQSWSIGIASPKVQPLAPGVYENPLREGFHTEKRPGLAVSANSHGCNQIRGRFLVSEITFDDDNHLLSLAVDFEQWCDISQAPLFGSLRINSAKAIVPRISVASVTALKGNAETSDATVIVSLSMPSDREVTAHLRTENGSARRGVDYQSGSIELVFPPGQVALVVAIPIIGNRQPRGDRTFYLRLQRSDVPIGAGFASVQILDPNVPMTVLTVNSDPHEFIGQGHSYLVTPADATFSAYRHTSENYLSIRLSGPDYWSVFMAAPDGRITTPGTYAAAERWPFQPAGAPGLDVGGRGRGYNTLTGKFVVHEAQYGSYGQIKRFSADFEQYNGGSPPGLYGSVRINAKLLQASVTNARIVGSNAIFTVTLNPPSPKTQIVWFRTRDGAARKGVDYTKVFRKIRFASGQTAVQVSVPILGTPDAGKFFYGVLSSQKTPLWISAGLARLQ